MTICFSETDLVRSICRKSFYSFVQEFWDLVVPDPFIANWHIKYLCDDIQAEVERILAKEPKRYEYIIYNVPPGSSKSTLLMIMLNGWVWCRNPSRAFIGSSYERDLAVEHARKARDLVKSDKYRSLFPNVIIKKDMDEKGTFGTIRKGARYSTGTTGNITGKHGDILVVDDPLNPKAARSESLTRSVNLFITETLSSRKRQKEISPTFLIMQRLAEDDPTGMLLALSQNNPQIRVKHICLPAIESSIVTPAECHRFYVNGLLDPKRLSREQLEREQVTLGDFAYAGQYEQSPIPAGGAMFKVDCIKTGFPCPDPTNPKLWVKQCRFTDKAATFDDGCFTASVRIGKDLDHRFWILHVERYRKESREREKRIRTVAEIDRIHVVQGLEQEGGSGGKDSALDTVRNLAGFRVVARHPTGSKPLRAEPLATQVNGGNVYLAPEGILPGLGNLWHLAFIGEMQFFPFSKYKDQIDAAAGAFNELNTSIFKPGFYRKS